MRGLAAAVGLVVLALVSPVRAGVLDAMWFAPTTNTDGSALVDLASYKLYYQLTNAMSTVVPCQGAQFVVVPAPAPTPQAGEGRAFHMTGLVDDRSYDVQVSAVPTIGKESVCSPVVAARSRLDGPMLAAGDVSNIVITVTVQSMPPVVGVGGRIQTTLDTAARVTPSTSSAILQIHTVGETGTVIAGPIIADGWTWWQVDYDLGVDGWSTSDRLQAVP